MTTTGKLCASLTCVHSSPFFLILNSLEERTVYSRCELLASSLEEIKQVLISNSVLTCLRATEKSVINQLALFNIIWNFRTRKCIGLRHYFFFRNYNINIFPLYFSSLHTFLYTIPTLLQNHGLFLFLFLFFNQLLLHSFVYTYISSPYNEFCDQLPTGMFFLREGHLSCCQLYGLSFVCFGILIGVILVQFTFV